VYAKVPPPNITSITPWGTAPLYAIQSTFANTSDAQFQDRIADAVTLEDTSATFAVRVNSTRSLSYTWFVDGTQNSTSENITINYGFFDSGSHTVIVNVSNDRYESQMWTWRINVTNVNRPPQLINPLENQTSVNGTLTITKYFTLGNGTKFYDPDDDLDSDGEIDANETTSITFVADRSCAVAGLSVNSADLTIQGTVLGNCTVRFNATDSGGIMIQSNEVLITVVDVPQGDDVIQTVTESGGGGGSSSRSTYVPLIKEEIKPEAFNLIAPKLVTIYQNNSIDIPIEINNTWNGPLKELRLGAETNVTGIETSFNIDFFEEIQVGETKQVILTVENYRLGENYEVLVIGNTSEPEFSDEALILLNSIEQASEGDELEVKVTFANDLLNEHPECQELQEVLDQAKIALSANNFQEAKRLVTSVISGCKYLVSTQQKDIDQPSSINPLLTLDDLTAEVIMWSVLAFVILLSISLLMYYHFSHKEEEDF
ncbi:PKD domain-containing protein, partial [Candidatus Woesearchaeota archaeon]|nr:PKD domain-containing protein [Candidatus Woesearchaeota archaeon]